MSTVLSPASSIRILHRSQLRQPAPRPLAKISVAQPAPVAAPSAEPEPMLLAEEADRAPTPPAPAPVKTPAPAGPRVNLIEHPAARHALSLLRTQQSPSWDFRMTSNQLLYLLAVEATRSLPLREEKGNSKAVPSQLLAKSVVFLSVTRDGLGLSHTLADCLPGVLVGGIGIERARNGDGLQARLHLASAPALNECRVILFDPAVNTGATVSHAYQLVRRLGATDICLLTYVVSSQALCRLQADFPDLVIWAAGVDTNWEPKKHGSSLLGDFGERLFG